MQAKSRKCHTFCDAYGSLLSCHCRISYGTRTDTDPEHLLGRAGHLTRGIVGRGWIRNFVEEALIDDALCPHLVV